MKPFVRSDRISGQIQKVLSDLLHKKINDPRITSATITGVKLTQNLRYARIYFSLMGTKKEKAEAKKGFDKARGYFKRILAGKLGLRYMPDLKFYYDETFDYGSKIDKILDSIKKKDGPDNRTFEEEQ